MARTYRVSWVPDRWPWSQDKDVPHHIKRQIVVRRLNRYYGFVWDAFSGERSKGERNQIRKMRRAHRYRNKARMRRGLDPERYDHLWTN